MFSFGRTQLRRLFLSSVLSLLGLLFFFFAGSAYSAQVTLAWDPNTEPDVAGYKIYYGLASDQYSDRIDVGNQTSYTVASLENGKTYYFAATAYDQYGDESDFSDEVALNIPVPCTFTVSPPGQSFVSGGGPGIVNVTTQSGCSWTALSNAPWLVVTSNSSVAGNGTANYSALSNTSASGRTGTLTVAGQSIAITQDGIRGNGALRHSADLHISDLIELICSYGKTRLGWDWISEFLPERLCHTPCGCAECVQSYSFHSRM